MLYALAAEDSNAWVNRGETRRALDVALSGAGGSTAEMAAATLAAWGTSSEAQSGQQAMMDLLR